jgi:ATP-binding cassette subfamily C protein
VLLFIAWRNQRATQEATQVATYAMAASHQAAQAVALNSDTVRALGMTGRMVQRQLGQRAIGLRRSADASFVGGRYSALSRFLRLFVQSAALGLGALLAIAGHISAGAIIAASILLGRALQPIEAVVGGWSTLGSARAALQRFANVLGSVPPERIHTQLPAPKGHVQVDQVGLRGPDGRPMLLGVSLEVKPGEMLGIIGPSGSGKTTLAKVIAGAIVPEVGSVRIDGAQLSDWEPDELAQYMGFLPQEPSLFDGTIKENISRFAGSAAVETADVDAQVIAAAKAAGVHEMILQLPQGYDTRLGSMGTGLSAGQAQRVALARALYGEPAVLILDEPNAFLDADGEAALLTAVQSVVRRGASVIMVAHRRSILNGANRLLVMEGGRPKLLGPAAEVAARLAAPPAGATAETAA